MSAKLKTLSFTSGKGGVGKTTLLVNAAIELAQQGKRVLIFDGDLGMANVDIMFARRTPYSLFDVVSGRKNLSDVLISLDEKIDLIPGGSGIRELHNLNEAQKRGLLEQVKTLPHSYDFLLIDTAPGIDDNVLFLNAASHEVQVIMTPEPASLTDAYALIKVLNYYYKVSQFSIICNQVRDEMEGLVLYRKLSDVASKFLYVGLDYKGAIPYDLNLRHSTRSQQLITKAQPQSPAAQAIRELSKKINASEATPAQNGGMGFFWEQLIGLAS